MTTKTFLRDVSPEAFWNYEICGHPTQVSGKPCKGRANPEFNGRCRSHDEGRAKAKALEAERQTQERIKAEQDAKTAQRERVEAQELALTKFGDKFRTDVPDDIAARHITLIHPRSGRQAKGKYDKRGMLNELKLDDTVLLAWTGSWSTDIFVLRVRDALERIKP